MSREDLIEHIVSGMRDPGVDNNNLDDRTTTICQNCGIQIMNENESEISELDDYVIHRVPEHGEHEMCSVFYCGPNCFQNSMDQLFDYSEQNSPSY